MKYVPATTSADDISRRGVTFSFRNKLDIMDAHTGEEALNGVALDAPIRFTLSKKMTPPTTMPRAPVPKSRSQDFLSRFHFLAGFDKASRKRERAGYRIAFA